MKIVRIRIRNFRCVKSSEIYPGEHTVLLGPNNVGKTAVLEPANHVWAGQGADRTLKLEKNWKRTSLIIDVSG